MNAKQKAKAGMALNLRELAAVTGYSYSSIKSMRLTLFYGKIREHDFWQIMKSRSRFERPTSDARAAVASPGGERLMQAIADKFRAPRSKNGPPAALPSRAARPVRSTV